MPRTFISVTSFIVRWCRKHFVSICYLLHQSHLNLLHQGHLMKYFFRVIKSFIPSGIAGQLRTQMGSPGVYDPTSLRGSRWPSDCLDSLRVSKAVSSVMAESWPLVSQITDKNTYGFLLVEILHLFFYLSPIFFFYLGFLSRPFTNHRTAGEGGGHFFNSSLPLPTASETLRH